MKTLSRREFLKGCVGTVIVTGSGIYLNPFEAFAGNPETDLIWDKAPCRFCGTGCSVMVGVQGNTIMAVKGDSKSSVNQGTLCIKGFSLPFILYGNDRLTTPLIRKKKGRYDKRGELTEATWDEALDLMAAKAQAAIIEKGPVAVAMFGSGQNKCRVLITNNSSSLKSTWALFHGVLR